MSKAYRKWKERQCRRNDFYGFKYTKASFSEYKKYKRELIRRHKKYRKLNSIFNSLPLHKSNFSIFIRYSSSIFPEEKIYIGNLRNFQKKKEEE